MEQQLDAFTQKRFELMVEMATKKLHQEIITLKEGINNLNNEIGSLKSQINRLQFQQQPPQKVHVQDIGEKEQVNEPYYETPKKKVEIVDCRPDGEKKQDFVSGAAKNSEPVRPRFGDYKSDDVSIDKFFYFGRK